MTGFISNLFRSKPKADVEDVKPAAKQKEIPASPAARAAAFFLEADEARTYGNLEYMRSAKSVRRTFSKLKVGTDNASVRTISSLAMEKLKAEGKLPIDAQPTTAPEQLNLERRRADSSLDAFRTMAREIRKGQ
ncbi:hypothetical protein IFO70_14960 [Phormidium tenue FACHB-886]|nr:hypothetical protein [Phormidium tenue FACHB-886]